MGRTGACRWAPDRLTKIIGHARSWFHPKGSGRGVRPSPISTTTRSMKAPAATPAGLRASGARHRALRAAARASATSAGSVGLVAALRLVALALARMVVPDDRPRARARQPAAPAGAVPEVRGRRAEPAGDARAAPGTGQPVAHVVVPAARPELRLDRVDDPGRRTSARRAGPASSTSRLPPGCVPARNSSRVVSRVHGPGLPPDHASMRAVTMPLGSRNRATGSPFVSWRTNDCHSGAAAVSEVAGVRARGHRVVAVAHPHPTRPRRAPSGPSAPPGSRTWRGRGRRSTCPSSRPPAAASRPARCGAGACRPRSRSGAGRCCPRGCRSRDRRTRPRSPARPSSRAPSTRSFPFASRISRIIRGAIRTPPLASVP